MALGDRLVPRRPDLTVRLAVRKREKEKGRTSARGAAFPEHNRPEEEIVRARL